MSAFSNYAEALMLDALMAPATTYYVKLHAPTTVAAGGAASGASTLNVDILGGTFPKAGAAIRIGAERHKVASAVDNGDSTATLTLDGTTLASTYAAGVFVGFSAEAKADLPPEVSYAGYAPQGDTFAAAVQGNPTEKDNDTELAFGDPDADGQVGSFSIWTTSDGSGELLVSDVLGAVVEYQGAVTDPLTIAAGALDITLD